MNVSADDIGFHLLDNTYELKKIKETKERIPQILE
jgi:hypothetical protein